MFFTILLAQALGERTTTCTAQKTLFDITESNYDQIIGGNRAVLVRMQNEGCPYAATSEQYWREAAELFPNIIFARAECIYNEKVCSKLGANVSPSHALFLPNSTQIKDSFGNPDEISSSSSYYANFIYQNLQFYPFDTATIDDLIPESTHKFFLSYKYPVFILYDSTCNEDSDFLAQWLIYATDDHITSDDYGFGKLDCSKYLEECNKWGATYPSANVFSREKAISVSITETDSLSDRVKSAILFIDDTKETYPTPAPYVPNIPTPVPVIPNTQTITVDSLQNRDISDIRTKYATAKARTNTGDDFTGNADVHACNDVSLKPEVITDSVRLLNFYRELAGLPNTVTNDESLNDGCYLAAKYSSRTGTISHDANDYFKKYCSFDAKWNIIKETLKGSNLANGNAHALDSLSGLFDDEGSSNEGVIGHRRWFLYPFLKSIGVGFYPVSRHSMTGYYVQYPPTTVYGLNYGTYTDVKYTNINFISWPSAGPFPHDRLPSSWTVYYHKFQDADVTVDDIVIKLSRDDGQLLETSRIDLSKSYYGLTGTLIFKLTDKSLNLITAGHSIHVQIYLLKGDTRDCLDYTVHFFDDQKEETVCFYNTDSSKCPSTIDQSKRYGKGQYENYRPTGILRTIIYVAEDITLSADLNFDFSSSFIVKGERINGKIIVGAGNQLDIHDASLTDIVLKNNPDTLKSGVLMTPGKTKSVTIEFTSTPTRTTRFRILTYVGSYTDIEHPKIITGNNYNYFFTLAYNDDKTYLVCTPVSYIEYACHGGERNYGIDSSIKCFAFSESNQLRSISTKKKMIRVYSDASDLEVAATNLPDNYVDYEFLISPGKINVQYSRALDHRAKTITIKNYKGGTISPTFTLSELGLSSYEESLSIYPFTNLYLINLDSSYTSKVSLPYLLGDEAAKEKLKLKELTTYDESINPFADENGYYIYSGSSSVSYPKISFITNGLHDEYTFNRTVGYYQLDIYVKPTQQTLSKPITINLAPQVDMNRRIDNIYIQNYEDVTIKTKKHQLKYGSYTYTLTYFQYVRLVNVSKVEFIDTEGQNPDSITTDIIGTANLEIVSRPDKPVTFSQLVFRTDNVVTGNKCTCTKAIVAESKPTIKMMNIATLTVYGDSQPLITNCTINSIEIQFGETDLFFPQLLLKNTQVKQNVKIAIKSKDYYYSKKINSLGDNPSLLIASLDIQLIESLKNGLTSSIIDDWGYDSTNTKYKFILSKDKKGIYVVKNAFDENNAPDSIPTDVEYLVSDNNFDINPPPPPDRTPQATYPPQQTQEQPTSISSSSNDEKNPTQEATPEATQEATPEATPVATPIPAPTKEPEDSVSKLDIAEGATEEELNKTLIDHFKNHDSPSGSASVVIVDISEVNFNTELEDNQYIKPKEGSTVNYNGGKLNLVLPEEVTVNIDNAENSKLSLKGEGNINISIKDFQSNNLYFSRSSIINGTVRITVPNKIESVIFEYLDLESIGDLSINNDQGDSQNTELIVRNLNTKYNSNIKIRNMKIEKTLNVVQSSTLNVDNVTLDGATIKYEIFDYVSLLDSTFFEGKFNDPPKSIVLDKQISQDITEKVEYSIISGSFEKAPCSKWLESISYGNTKFNEKKCIENSISLSEEKMRIVLSYVPQNVNNGSSNNKLGKGYIIGIVIGVVAAIAIAIVIVVIIVMHKRKKNYEESTEGADLNELGNNNNTDEKNEAQIDAENNKQRDEEL